MPKYNIHLETENLNETQLRILHVQLSALAILTDGNNTLLFRRIDIAERIDPRFIEQHIAERVR